MNTNTQAQSLVEMQDVSISFGGIHAVDHASVDLFPGEVVALLGHNGAGKSTLIKILSGAYQRDGGEINIDGKPAAISNPRDAKGYGIETIYQTLALADNVDTAANLYLGRELLTPWGTLDDVAMEAKAREVMGRLNPRFQRFKEPVKALSGGTKAVSCDRPGNPVQRPYPDHGRTDRGARSGGDRTGFGIDPATQVRRHRHLPDQPRHCPMFSIWLTVSRS